MRRCGCWCRRTRRAGPPGRYLNPLAPEIAGISLPLKAPALASLTVIEVRGMREPGSRKVIRSRLLRDRPPGDARGHHSFPVRVERGQRAKRIECRLREDVGVLARQPVRSCRGRSWRHMNGEPRQIEPFDFSGPRLAGAMKREVVNVPVLITSPAASGAAPGWVAAAEASSARQSAGLRRTFLPAPSSASSPFMSNRTVNRERDSVREGIIPLSMRIGVPTMSAA